MNKAFAHQKVDKRIYFFDKRKGIKYRSTQLIDI